MPFKANSWINFDYTNNVMYVSTYGGGVWKRSIPATTIDTVANVKGFPNPFRFSSSVSKLYKIVNLPADSTLEIYGSDGTLVRKLASADYGNTGVISWDCKNASGENVPAGVYFYAAVSSFGTKTGKIAILK